MSTFFTDTLYKYIFYNLSSANRPFLFVIYTIFLKKTRFPLHWDKSLKKKTVWIKKRCENCFFFQLHTHSPVSLVNDLDIKEDRIRNVLNIFYIWLRKIFMTSWNIQIIISTPIFKTIKKRALSYHTSFQEIVKFMAIDLYLEWKYNLKYIIEFFTQFSLYISLYIYLLWKNYDPPFFTVNI